RAPVGQGIELGQHRAGAGETGIALNNGDAGTGARALIFPLTADPGIERVQFSLERFDFANAATFLMTVAIKAEQSLGADQRSDRCGIWCKNIDRNAVVFTHLFNKLVGFGMRSPGIQGEHLYIRLNGYSNINQHHVFGTAKRNSNIIELLERVLKDLAW